VDPNPYKSPKGLDPSENTPDAVSSRWRCDHVKLVLGVAAIVGGAASLIARESQIALSEDYKLMLCYIAVALFVLGLAMMWDSISRHEDAEEDEA